jgi:hypothetical protein
MLAQGTKDREQRHAEHGEMVSLDPFEQVYTPTLDPENPDAIANLGPFEIEIAIYEIVF